MISAQSMYKNKSSSKTFKGHLTRITFTCANYSQGDKPDLELWMLDHQSTVQVMSTYLQADMIEVI